MEGQGHAAGVCRLNDDPGAPPDIHLSEIGQGHRMVCLINSKYFCAMHCKTLIICMNLILQGHQPGCIHKILFS